MPPSAIQVADPQPGDGWQARLRLRLARRGLRTVLTERWHQGPLLVQRPFYPEGDVCHLYLVHPPGGVAGGDQLQLSVQLDAGAHALLTTPAATKLYRAAASRVSSIDQEFAVCAATLEWLPQETIVFSGAQAVLRTRVNLSGAARFIGWEVLCLGRPACDEKFDRGEVRQNFEIRVEGRPLLLDRLRLRGDDPALQGNWGMAGHSVLGTMLAYPATVVHLSCARSAATLASTACTLADGVLVVRLRGDNGEQVREEFHRIRAALRPSLIDCAPHAPRIWAT